ncbi:Nucleoside deaminase [Pandoravirus dulcis]|uniref:Nucleoside deaminase n=1 Tax=Pandoravirus dulcis TaxID=1349409 RepID=S4VYT2_9VIRU|nr:Nucleoside deaminase [Pandoravirus dulcis]AGO83226.1 Nucleoside deaminase [Pandoravirus dulcis]
MEETRNTAKGDARCGGLGSAAALPAVATRSSESVGAQCDAVGEDATVAEALDAAARRAVAETVRTATEAVRASQPGLFTAAVLGADGQVVARGRNRVFDACDPTAHAEIEAIRAACRVRGSIALDACVLCSNAEPCPMCLSAAYWAGIRLVYYACPKETVAAAVGFDDARLYADLALPACQRTLIQTVHVDCADAADAFYAWRHREASAPTAASTVSPSARADSLASEACAPCNGQ